jgi:hypothetical protein
LLFFLLTHPCRLLFTFFLFPSGIRRNLQKAQRTLVRINFT